MRILWLGNPLWAGSGYGQQAALFIPRLRELGHEIALAANFGLGDVKLEWNGLTTYPSDGQWGNVSMPTFAEHFRADLVIALCDAWVLRPDMWPEDLRVACWAPVDHFPIPPPVVATLKQPQVTSIAMSRFGEQQMRDVGLEPFFVPHGVDTKVFYPRPEIKAEVRRELEVPEDAFLVGMVAANSDTPTIPRKGHPFALHAFAGFAKDHPDAWMYIHSPATGKGNRGLDLDKIALATGCPPDRVRFPPDKAWHLGMGHQLVANLYPAFDVLLAPSMGEGFGVPIIEAQACGVPVITSDHSAMSENLGVGWLVQGDPWWDSLQESFLIAPSHDSIRVALEAAYEQRDLPGVVEAAAGFAAQFDADHVTETHWKPTLEQIAKPKEVAPLNGGLNRKQRRALAKA